ncbi:MAG TPA: DUF4139 domain-containing protein [Candidatus Dormibacteraeota bacterium]|nr:DUF4139 domain-containing protein [Candidatus Dormibacteraeota bacterium]
MYARFVCLLIFCASLYAQQVSPPSLTIYNQDFAVVRQDIPLELKSGVNQVNETGITMHLEPDSVVLRDPSGKHAVQVLEQNYRADPISEPMLLSLYEGKTLEFEVSGGAIVKGKVIRSGYVPHNYFAMNRYGQGYYQAQMVGAAEQPVIEVNGQLRFSLPGIPIFPSLTDDSILKPRLEWLLSTDKPGKFPAEFSYVTGGMSWQADYNIVAPEKGDVVDIVGWVTIDNQSGRTFESARIKLMAGDVSKIQPEQRQVYAMRVAAATADGVGGPAVSEKAFDEYHLYTLERSTTLRDRETKQVEFIHASNVATRQLYIYEGAKIDPNRYNGWNWENIRNDHNYGTESNPKVWVMREFVNSEANHLGMPLPKGRVRFYRRNDDGQIEFTGENMIDHTPHDETVRMYTGNAFDITGERRRTSYTVEPGKSAATETFEIRVRNHKKEAVEVRVVEHLYRGKNWEIAAKSDEYKKKDSQTVEFPVTVAPDGEKVITYTAHYTW